VEHSKPEPDNVPNGASHHGANEPSHANTPPGEDHRWLRSVVDNSSEIVTIVDPDGTLRYASPAFGRVLGYDPEEAIGTMNVLDYVHLDDLPHVLEETQEALSKGGVVTNKAEYRFRHRDGSWRWMESVGTYLLDDPHVGGVVVTSRDVTERKETEEALRRSEAEVFGILESITDAFFSLDWEWRFAYVNHQAEALLNRRREDLIGERIWEDSTFYPQYRRAVAEGSTVRFEAYSPLLKKWFSVRAYPSESGLSVYFQDVTERKKAEEKLRFQARLLDTVGESVIAIDMEGRVLYWNRAAKEMYGWSSEEAMGRRLIEMVIPENFRGRAEDIAAQLREGKEWTGEFVVRRRDGTTFPVEGTNRPVFGEDGDFVGVIGVLRDITERKQAEERLYHQAHHDLLTDLPNRQLFLERLGQALKRTGRRPGYKVALLFVDLDNFKVVNDSLGHEVGDMLLVRVGERLKRCLRPKDTLARFGGDEFVMLLENLSGPRDAVRVAERIIEELRSPFVLEGRELVLRASIGIALGDDRTKGPGELLKDADTAMYRAKEEVSGYRIFEPKMYEQALRRLKVENDMRRAVEAGEFVVHYQPIVDLRTGEVWGSEALVRWEHPERGLLDPSQFVPVAEETGLIVPLGERVLEEACRRAVQWQRKRSGGVPPTVCVNLSARQLGHQDLADTVEGILRRTGLEGRCLCLDITETLYITVLEGNTKALSDLRRMGVRISIDDFGMGYSSLSYLKRLPADTLKIDRSFVAGLGEDAEDSAIVQMTIDLAHTLGMRIIAEGVESEEQAEQLKEMGCDLGQGYYFAEPLSPEALSEFFR
jgi:diguanylate cyclase (GGDEF)-like protein/PAS domain S-box-containing protein